VSNRKGRIFVDREEATKAFKIVCDVAIGLRSHRNPQVSTIIGVFDVENSWGSILNRDSRIHVAFNTFHAWCRSRPQMVKQLLERIWLDITHQQLSGGVRVGCDGHISSI